MTRVTPEDVRTYVLGGLAESLHAIGLTPATAPYDLDLLEKGVIDSLGILEIVTGLEERFGLIIDFEELDPNDLTIIGPFSEYVAARSSSAGP